MYIYITLRRTYLMVRTQIYLDEGQKTALDKLSAESGATVSELIRRAVDEFIAKRGVDFEDALERSFGIWRGRKDIGKTRGYVRKLRSEWEDR